MNKTPQKWTEVYPVGTKEGDEEARFFRALARNPKYEWRSVAALGKEASLSKERVEEIIMKYHNKGMVFQNPKNEDQWGYWQRVPQMLSRNEDSINKIDQDSRIDKITKATSPTVMTPKQWKEFSKDSWMPLRPKGPGPNRD